MTKISRAMLNVAVHPGLIDFITAVAQNNARSLLSDVAITDNSTGVAPTDLAPILTQDARVPASGSNLAPRAGFNTAVGKANDAIAVLATFLNTNVLAKLGLTQFSNITGTVATPGTVPALDKALTATDGTTNTAMLRSEANAAIVRLRNNLGMVVRGVNIATTALGLSTLSDKTGGSIPVSGVLGEEMKLGASVTADTQVLTANVATSDLAADANIDAALTAFANDVAKIAATIDAMLDNTTVLSAKVPIVLVP